MVRLSTQLEIFMARHKLTAGEAAKRLQVSRDTLRSAMDGKKPSPRIVGQMAEHMGVPVEDLYDLATDSTKSAQANADASSSVRDDTPTPPAKPDCNMQPPASGNE